MPHAFSIKTAGSRLPQGELNVFTEEADTKKAKSERDFDVCESGPGQGAEA
ncbi:hypothetical protein NQZ68_004114 [Dissostichus eleginoides]|nr:hypothetical protein NQZ68_004114 [Dissostichus eleginoides]